MMLSDVCSFEFLFLSRSHSILEQSEQECVAVTNIVIIMCAWQRREIIIEEENNVLLSE